MVRIISLMRTIILIRNVSRDLLHRMGRTPPLKKPSLGGAGRWGL